MKYTMTLVAAAGLASVFALPVSAETSERIDGLRGKPQAAEHTDISSQRYYRRGYRYGYGPRYGYYRPYAYGYRPYGYGYGYRPYYGPSVGLGFYGGPRFGVWF